MNGRGRNQNGHLYQRGGSWQGRFRVAGERVTYTLGRVDELTEAQARQKLRDLIKSSIKEKRALEAIGGQVVVIRGNIGSDKHLVGAQSELRVCLDLLAKGWSVYRAIDGGAACDLVAIREPLMLRVEVKTDADRIKLAKKRGCFDVLALVGRDGLIRYFAYSSLPEFGTIRTNLLVSKLQELPQDERILATNWAQDANREAV